jgi:outer membrane protein assembly factor BamB
VLVAALWLAAPHAAADEGDRKRQGPGAVIARFVAAAGETDTRESNWPAWRGPNGTGVSEDRGLPLKWSASENVRWKAPLPGPGNSTPIVWGDRVFLTQALEGGKRRAVLALARGDGKRLWQQEVTCATDETTHRQNPPCSASPVTDGTAVYAHFASAGAVAYDLTGKQLWKRDLGPVLHKWGNGSSPVLYGDLLIVFHGPGEPTFLMALDKRTGKTVWKTEETAINSPVFGSWSTPVIVRAGDHEELIMPLPGERIGGEGMFKGYDPATGKELWRCGGLGNEVYAMPIVAKSGDLVVGISGHNGPLMAVWAGGRGDVTASHRLWRQAEKNPQRIGSGVLHQGRLYVIDAPGVVECLDAKTGEVQWKERLPGNLWGSMLLGDGKLYVTNLEGTTYVLSAGPKFEVLARNEIKEPTYAAPAAASGEIFIRTYENLYCIGPGK